MSIKRGWLLTALLAATLAWGVQAAERGGGGMRGGGGGSFHPVAPQRPAQRPSVVINMARPSSGYRMNFPSRQRSSAPAARPSWGHVRWSQQPSPAARGGQAVREGVQAGHPTLQTRAPAGTLRPSAGTRMASVQHHHPYTQGYVRQKLRRLGVNSEPGLITDRAEILHTDRAHSSIAYPTHGPKGAALNARPLDPRDAGDAATVGRQMAVVNDPGWRANVESYNALENRAGHYYWHHDNGFNYCHYLDQSGYQWYGWYLGGGFFWTRDFDGRWWRYDQADMRWDFYNNNFWWWQDPNHVGDLYCYNDGTYIPVNSAEDQIVVTQPALTDFQAFTSPDGSRTVKLVAGGADAFLYDNTNPPAFDPVYLASGVESVQFSDPGNGRPLEIVLKLDDGSFDLFDAQGQAYSPGLDDADAAQYDAQQAAPPATDQTAPPSAD